MAKPLNHDAEYIALALKQLKPDAGDIAAQQQLACDLYNSVEDDLNDEGYQYQDRPDLASLGKSQFVKGIPANDA